MDGYLRTSILLAGLTAIFGGVGWLIAGPEGALIALGVAALMNVWAWWNSGNAVLRMHNAQPIGPNDAPRLYQMTAALAATAGLPMPALYVIQEAQPNAFATGRNPANAAVAVTTGLLDSLPENEVAGVIAHELAHIRNHDTLLMTVTATLAGAVSLLSQFGFMFRGRDGRGMNAFAALAMMILAPLAAMLVQMAISRAREFEADRVGAEISGAPHDLAQALLRLEQGAHVAVNETAEANPASAHMFIINPLAGLRMDRLFTTHPATADRVAALEAMAGAVVPMRAGNPWAR